MTVSRPDPDEYARFLRGELTGGDNRRVVRHLLAAWRACRELGQIWDGALAPASGPRETGYGEALGQLGPRIREHVLTITRERRRLPELINLLRSAPEESKTSLLRSTPRFQSWHFGEWLIEESQRHLYVDLNQAGELASSAVTLVEELSPQDYGAPLVNDLRARAWSCKAETLRVLSDLRGADEAFTKAEALVGQGTGDALEEARILELKAALYRDQQRSREAHQLLDEVIAIYRQYRDFHLLGRAFVQKGRAYSRSNDHEEGILWLRKGLGLLDPARERYFDLSARQSLMLCLHESGRPREARFLLKASRPEFLQHGSPVLILRLGWLEGKVWAALGFPEKAEEALVEARNGFIGLGIAFSAAAVSLDLAGLYAAQGRAAEMRSLAEEVLPIFQSRDLQREAMAALIAFHQAARMEEINAHLLGEIRSYLDQARSDPKLRCEPV